MYYQNYEDYMRAVLGYPLENKDTYRMNYLEEVQNYNIAYQNTKELEDMYPEIYKIMNPVICDMCDRCTNPITKDIVENMVEEIYNKIESNNEISIRINIDKRSTEKELENKVNNIKTNTIRNNALNNSEQVRKVVETENRQRRPQNPFLKDLIRILILNRLLGGNFPNRPPHHRPPFPGEPRPPRPQPRNYENYL